MNFSIIIPVFNEQSNISNLVDEIFFSLKKYKNNFEVVIVEDKSIDDTKKILNIIKKKHKPYIITIYNDKNYGQSLSLIKGINVSTFNTIITIDGDGQNDPADIPKMLEIFKKSNYSLVGGIRVKRKDNLLKLISSKIANFIRSAYLADGCPDTGCSLKIFNKETFLKFDHFDGIHRFIPALFLAYNEKNFYLPVNHRPRIYGKSNYGTFIRAIKGLRDMYKVKKMIKKIKLQND